MASTTSDAFDDHAALVAACAPLVGVIDQAAEVLAAAFAAGGRCFALGNGGSAADAQHFVAELVGHFDGPGPGLPAVALTTDASVLTSIANDLGYEAVFARQIEALGGPGDVVVVISTSGRSPNVVAAADAARAAGCTVVAVTGGGGGELGARADLVIDVPSRDTQRIQEIHCLVLHTLVAGARGRLDPGGPRP